MGQTRDKENIIVFYVGTRKLVAMAGVLRDGEPRITGRTTMLYPEGFKEGLVANLERASNSLEKALKSLNPPAEAAAYVVLGNAKLKTFTFSSSQYFQDATRVIASQDIVSVIDQTKSVATLPLAEIVLQTMPVSFLVNDLQDVSNPIGLEAQRLGVCLKLFTMDAQDFKNITRAFETLEIEIKDYFPKMLTASEAVLTDQEKAEGSLLIDIAGEATFLTLWYKGEIVQTRLAPYGGRYLSSQLANLWEIDLADAEKVKEQYGSLEPDLKFKEELIPLVDRNGKKGQQISRQKFHEKYLDLAKKWLEKILVEADHLARDEKVFHPHCIFTGGGSSPDGFLEFLQHNFSREGRIGLIRKMDIPNQLQVDPSLTSALGMYSWLSYSGSEKARLVAPQSFFGKTLSSARGWLSTYF